MGIVIRQGISGSIVNYVGIVVGYINVVLLFPHFLSEEQFGLTRILLAAASLLSQFSQFGITNILLRFFPVFRNKENGHNGILFLSSIIPLLGFFITIILFLTSKEYVINLYSDKSTLVSEHFCLLIPLCFFMIYFNLFSAYSISLFHTTFSMFLNEILLRILQLLTVILYHLNIINFDIFILLFICSHAIITILMVFYIFLIGEFNFKPHFGFLSKKLMNDISKYGLFTILSGMSILLINNIDILMLGWLAGLSDTAVYSVAFYIGNIIIVPARSINRIIMPILSDAWKNNDLKQIQNIYHKTSMNQIIIGVLIFSLVLINIDSIFKFLPETYHTGKWVVLLIGLSKLLDTASGPNTGIISTSRYYYFDTLFTLILVVLAVITNFVFIPEYGINGAAIACIISFVFYNGLMYFFILYTFKMQPFSLVSLFPPFLSLLLICGIYFIPFMINIYFTKLFRTYLLPLAYLPLLYISNASPDLTAIVYKILKRIQSFFQV
jgi:O-antigen/teichoic acid export membrane protein